MSRTCPLRIRLSITARVMNSFVSEPCEKEPPSSLQVFNITVFHCRIRVYAASWNPPGTGLICTNRERVALVGSGAWHPSGPHNPAASRIPKDGCRISRQRRSTGRAANAQNADDDDMKYGISDRQPIERRYGVGDETEIRTIRKIHSKSSSRCGCNRNFCEVAASDCGLPLYVRHVVIFFTATVLFFVVIGLHF